MYNRTEGGMQSFALNWPGDVSDIIILNLYDVTAMTGVETYSDLEYRQIDLSVGGTSHVNPALYLTASAGYKDFQDDQAYVYGDQDGSMYTGYLGVGYRF